jgi:protein SCO1
LRAIDREEAAPNAQPMNPAPDTPRRNLTSAIVPALAAAGLAGLATMLIVSRQGDTGAAPPQGCILENIDAVGGPIALLDANGNAVTQADFASGPAVVYFGFTHCPDVCPTTLYALGEALQQPGGFDVQPVFITVDPERDTPAVIDAYVRTPGFPAGLAGLTGSPAQIRAAADAFRTSYARVPVADSALGYTMDHQSLLYVMDEHWVTRAAIPTIGQSPEAIAACISAGLSAH